MIRVPLVNPLLLLLAAQARQSIPALGDDPWRGLGLVLPQGPDSDRTCLNWKDSWAPGTILALEAARRHFFFTDSALAVPQPEQVAQAAFGPDAHPDKVALIPWAVQGRRYHPDVVEAMVRAKGNHQQVWLDVPFEQVAEAAQERLVQDGLRLGCAWFLRPPIDATDQPAYLQALRLWGQQVLAHRDFDQWIWPWADLVVRGLVSYALTGDVPKRQGAPAGCPAHASGLHWPQLSRDLMGVLCSQLGSETVARDLFMGLLLEFQPLLADESLPA